MMEMICYRSTPYTRRLSNALSSSLRYLLLRVVEGKDEELDSLTVPLSKAVSQYTAIGHYIYIYSSRYIPSIYKYICFVSKC